MIMAAGRTYEFKELFMDRSKAKYYCKRFLIMVGSIYIFFCMAVYVMQDNMLFIPNKDVPYRTPESVRLDFQDLMLQSGNHEINVWYIKAPNAKGTVLFCHGNAGNLAHRVDTAKTWVELGYNILLYDYAGYGKSSGSPSEKSFYHNIQTCYDWLIKNGTAKEEIIAHGRSLGGASASYIAVKEQLPVLILESTFTSVPDMAHHRFPWLPTALLCRNDFDTAERLKEYRGRLKIMHSPGDEIIPYEMAVQMAQDKGIEITQLKGGHAGVYDHMEDYQDLLLDFLRTL